jgi:hypothetical protein
MSDEESCSCGPCECAGGFKCAKCGAAIVFDGKNNEATCTECGTVNTKPTEIIGVDFLGGCIPFTGTEKMNPEGSIIRSPDITVLDLVRNFVILKDGEISTIRPVDMEGRVKILAVEPNEAAITILNKTYQGEGILIKSLDGDLKTFEQWPEGFAMWAVQATRAGSGINVIQPAGRKLRQAGVRTIPRAGATVIRLGKLA